MNLNSLEETPYKLWRKIDSNVVIYLPQEDKDCVCSEENIELHKPKSLLEKSLVDRSLLFPFRSTHNHEFKEIPSTNPFVVRRWYGTLSSCTPFKHLLRLSKLTGLDVKDSEGKTIVPFRLGGKTHEIHAFYHPKNDVSKQTLLFKVQIGIVENIALQLIQRVALQMISVPRNQGFLLLRPNLQSYTNDKWGEFISLQVEDLISKNNIRNK